MKAISTNDLTREARDRARRYTLDARAARRYVAYRREAINAVIAALPELESAVLEVTADGDSINVTLAGSRAQLLEVWGALRSTVGEPGQRMETPEDAEYFTTFFGTGDDPVRVWFSYSSTTCHRRQVGTTMVETPVYVVECS